jgi:hypothetical protein
MEDLGVDIATRLPVLVRRMDAIRNLNLDPFACPLTGTCAAMVLNADGMVLAATELCFVHLEHVLTRSIRLFY